MVSPPCQQCYGIILNLENIQERIKIIVEGCLKPPVGHVSHVLRDVFESTVVGFDVFIQSIVYFFTCERKSSTGEISTNFGKKWKVFAKELKRMQVIPHRYIICEFPLSHIYSFPTFSSIPNSQWKGLKITSAFLAKRIEEICGECDINVIFSEDRLDAERKFIEIVHAITD